MSLENQPMTIITQLAHALVAAGYGKDGHVNTYAVQQAGICESGRLSRILRGENVPSVATVEEILSRIDRELAIRKIRRCDHTLAETKPGRWKCLKCYRTGKMAGGVIEWDDHGRRKEC